MRYYWTILFALFLSFPSFSQLEQRIDFDLEWDLSRPSAPWFDGAIRLPSAPGLLMYQIQVPLPGPGTIDLELESIQESTFDLTVANLSSAYTVSGYVFESQGDYTASILISTMRKFQETHILESATLVMNWNELTTSPTGGPSKTKSVLSEGDIYKLSIPQDGLYKITGAALASNANINLSSFDYTKLELFGNPGGVVPLDNNIGRNDDLEPIPFQWVGLEDSKLDPQDYLVFYAEGSETWSLEIDQWTRNVNPYDDRNYVFLRLGQDEPSEMEVKDGQSLTGVVKSSSLERQYYGKGAINLLGKSLEHQGSGTLWVSDEISNTREFDLSEHFEFSSRVSGSPVSVHVEMYGRSESTTTFELHLDNEVYTRNVGRIDRDIEATYARKGLFEYSINPTQNNFEFKVEYPETSQESDAWLDFATVISRKSLDIASGYQILTDTFSEFRGGFEISNWTSDAMIWDITDYNDVHIIKPSVQGNKASFEVDDPNNKVFAVLRPNQVDLQPESWEALENQNIHGLLEAELVTVYHPLFVDQVMQHAEHRRSWDQMNVSTIDANLIYNEFGSGRREPGAIRDFAKMLHERDSNFKYLLLFGDGSYDYKYQETNNENQNFIPVFETLESLDPIYAYPSDDFYTLLSDNEGARLRGLMDIAVGRLLCRSEEEAQLLVDKIIHYDTNPVTFGDWRNKLVYMADDEDGNQHLNDVERIAKSVGSRYPYFNQEKIYFDAYEQVSTPGGTRFPEVTESINTNAFKGALTMVYLGHGGPTGLAQERALQSKDILEWDNMDNLPVFMTATCSFTAYDEPSITSAGEHCVLSQKGGAIAILSTVRAVYAGDNFVLTRAVHDYIFERNEGTAIRLGEVMRLGKNSVSSGGDDSNSRKFSLFGDPSLKIALPEFDVATTKINGEAINAFSDTLGALDIVRLEGSIIDHNDAVISNFNGILNVTLFDKPITLKTKGTDSRSYEQDFDLQKNILFRGSATVEGGAWDIEFVLPKDINFNLGNGKVSYYAHDNDVRDAAGWIGNIVIGGNGNDSLQDDQGPVVEVFMNDEHFIDGGITNPDPTLFVKLSDDYGINVVGNSIGHDLTGVLDRNTQNIFVLNDFYTAEKDDYRKGTVSFPLFNLEDGPHHIQVTAWDISNNFSEGETNFVVVSDASSSIKEVLSYPNPFSDYTTVAFEHNFPPGNAEIEVRIVSAAGREVNKLKYNFDVAGFRVTDVTWDGTDYSGSKVTNGVYLYKITMRRNVLGNEITKESSFERVVVLK